MQYKLFLDLDGVLVDFDAGVVRATGRPPHALDVRTMWSRLARARGFFEHLGWTADGRALVTEGAPGQAHPFDEAWGQLLGRSVARP